MTKKIRIMAEIEPKEYINKKTNNGYVIGMIIFIFAFLIYGGQYFNESYNANVEGKYYLTCCIKAFLNVLSNAFIIGAGPLLIKLVKRSFYKRNLITIYVINAILWMILSIPFYNCIDESNKTGIGLLGAIIFSIAVYNMLRGKENCKENFCDTKYEFRCSNCGTMCREEDKYCKNCKAIFDEQNNNFEQKNSNIDKKDLELRKLKKLLDDKIITKCEFENEKKKILNEQ